MARTVLTDARIKSLRPADEGKRCQFMDATLTGFYFRGYLRYLHKTRAGGLRAIARWRNPT